MELVHNRQAFLRDRRCLGRNLQGHLWWPLACFHFGPHRIRCCGVMIARSSCWASCCRPLPRNCCVEVRLLKIGCRVMFQRETMLWKQRTSKRRLHENGIAFHHKHLESIPRLYVSMWSKSRPSQKESIRSGGQKRPAPLPIRELCTLLSVALRCHIPSPNVMRQDHAFTPLTC